MSARFNGQGPERANRPSAGLADPSPAQFQRIVDAIGSRRSWRRMAKRAAAAHERELIAAARRLAAMTPPVLAAASEPLRGVGQAAVVTLGLSLPGWELVLSGVAASAVGALDAGAESRCRLTRAGRYGSFWWIEVASDRAGAAPVVLLGSQLRLSATGDGRGILAPALPAVNLPAGHR